MVSQKKGFTLNMSTGLVLLLSILLTQILINAKPVQIGDCEALNFQLWNKLNVPVSIKLERFIEGGKTLIQWNDTMQAALRRINTRKGLIDSYTVLLSKYQARQDFDTITLDADQTVEFSMNDVFALPHFPSELKFTFTLATGEGIGQAKIRMTKDAPQSLYLRINQDPKTNNYYFGPQTGPGVGRFLGKLKDESAKTESGCPVSPNVKVEKLSGIRFVAHSSR